LDTDFHLLPEEYKIANAIFMDVRLKYVRVERRSLNDFLDKWSKIVVSVERGYRGIVAEYQNDLSYRDMLEEVRRAAPDVIQEKLTAVLVPLDKRFCEATYEVSQPLFINKSKEDGFWWFRVPRKLQLSKGMEEYTRRDWMRQIPDLVSEFYDPAK
jgi:hypothetical protein